MKRDLVLGIDFGTDSVRALIVDSVNGKELSVVSCSYKRWREGLFCDPGKNIYRQHPQDYIDALIKAVKSAVAAAPTGTAEEIRGLSMDMTGSTLAPVDASGVPLALTNNFEENPNAMFILWKDHSAAAEAEEITQHAKTWGGADFTKYSGGAYSSEWFWAKILHIIREDSAVRTAAWSWVEHCDWMPALLCGIDNPTEIKRSRCAAGHKAMWHKEWGGLPSDRYLESLDSLFIGIRERLYSGTYTADKIAGNLSEEWAGKLGLPSGISVGIGAIDAHFGAVGAGIKPRYMLKVIGTSTCDMIVREDLDTKDPVEGISGEVDGSILPGMIGYEAGQSAFGDIYSWFKKFLLWPVRSILDESVSGSVLSILDDRLIPELDKAAAALPYDESVLALDWMNGRRSPGVNPFLKGAVTGLTLGTNAPVVFKSLVEATAFGSKRILDRFLENDIEIDGIIALGGIAKKSPFVMQTLADILDRPILVAASDETCALGAAMFASVAAGIYKDIRVAQSAMDGGIHKEYKPDPERTRFYRKQYDKYLSLGGFIESEQ